MPDPKIGLPVLETLTTGMYNEPLDAIREYLQNAADATMEAERLEIVKPGRGRVRVQIDQARKCLCIRDEGTGIRQDLVEPYLLNVGMSEKEASKDAGFRGIGRLAGIAYCDTLRFSTSAVGEPIESTVEIECAALAEAVRSRARRRDELAKVFAEHVRVERNSTDANAHYFSVDLIGVKEQAAKSFLDCFQLERYLCQVAPVAFDPQRFMYATLIQEWLSRGGVRLPTVELQLTDQECYQRSILKPYGTFCHTKRKGYDIHITGVSFFPEQITRDTKVCAWYGESELLGAIDSETEAGLRLRHHNISIGGSARVDEMFTDTSPTNERFNRYFIGEVHVLSTDVTPNARRDGFEPTPEWLEIKESIAPLIRELCSKVRAKSAARNRPMAKLTRSAESAIMHAEQLVSSGAITSAERNRTVEDLDKQKKNIEDALKGDRKSGELEQLQEISERLSDIQDRVTSADTKRATLSSELNRKERKLINEILALLSETLDDPSFEKAKQAILTKYGTPNGDTK